MSSPASPIGRRPLPSRIEQPRDAAFSRELKPDLVVAGKYRLERPLNAGSMGAVWIARHISLETKVAIKFIADGNEDTKSRAAARVRFQQEATAAAQIRSTNVVQTLDYGVDADTPYIVMELLEGEDLKARLDREGRLSLSNLSSLVSAIARALHIAHANGLVHRDLKPANIFLAKEGDEEVPKVLDFGVAKAMGKSMHEEGTAPGTIVGTPTYMSPEQLYADGKVDHRADVWALGVIAYRAATGQRPFDADTLVELAVQICNAEPPRPTSLLPSLPAELDKFFAIALDKDANRRFQSARELARVLTTVVRNALGESIPPRSDGSRDSFVATPVSGVVPALEPAIDATNRIRQPMKSDPDFLGSLPSLSVLDRANGPYTTPAAEWKPIRPVALSTQPMAMPPEKHSRSSAWLVLVGLVVFGLTSSLVWFYEHGDDAASPRAAGASTIPVTAEAPSAKDAPPSDSEIVDLDELASDASTSAATSTKKKTRKAPKKKVDCTDPYFWDDAGVKHILDQCL